MIIAKHLLILCVSLTTLLFAKDENFNSVIYSEENYKINPSVNQLAYSNILLRDSLSFRTKLLWGEKGLFRKINLAPPDLKGEMKLRRNMLQWHQRLGLITLGAITYQFLSGKKQYNNNFDNFTTERQKRHKVLGYTTYGLYLSTASLSLLAPPSRKQSKGLSSTKIHKLLAIVHFSAMIAQPWLGYKAARATNAADYDKYIDLHNIAGTVTMISFSLSFLTTLFP
ncbi:MAG: hypothetical protein V3W20_00095 [Candidatus Neomarinimicrobiota bacterium]